MAEKLENMADSNQKWQESDKMTEKLENVEVLQIIFCQASHSCPAKLPFWSCQAPISVLPRLRANAYNTLTTPPRVSQRPLVVYLNLL